MKIPFDIETYKTRFLGGARQYLFYAFFSFPFDVPFLRENASPLSATWQALLKPFGYGSNSDVIPYLVRSTSLPDSTFEEVQIPYPGHVFKMAGARAYGDWTVSFNLDEEGRLLEVFNKWHNSIYDPLTQQASEPETYMKTQQLFMIDGTGEVLKEYMLISAWPKTIGAVSLDYSTTDVATIDVTFAYQFYRIRDKGTETEAGKRLLKAAFNRLTGSALSLPR